MAAASKCFRIWKNVQLKEKPQTCRKSCFEPSNGNCANVQVLQVVNRKSNFAKPVVEPALSTRRRFNLLEACSKFVPTTTDKSCNLCAGQKASLPTNLCSTQCRPLSTMLRTKELTVPMRPKPSYKHSVLLDDKTIAGRVFPIKFRIQRKACQCQSCKRDLCLRETVTSIDNLILLSNCCNVEVYPRKKIDNWHLVPVGTITGQELFTKRTLNEICKLEPKKIVEPPPEPTRTKHKSLSLSFFPKKKKNARKSKGKNKKKKKV